MRAGWISWGVVGMACAVPPMAKGEIRTFAMEGTVTIIQNPTGALDFVHLGDRVVYTFAFDSDAPDQNGAPSVGSYSFVSSSLFVNGKTIPSSPGGILIGHPLDIFDVDSSALITGLTNTFADFRLSDQAESNALESTALPSDPYDLGLFEAKGFLIQGLGPAIPPDTYPSISSFQGPIDSFYVAPEPSTALLLCLAALFLTLRYPIRS